ncbi:type VII secretion integral membrane protein EccD [Corynebacterium sp. Q4381]|uniref:type VII secretion integral membrane protein EccD n=1 Tax=Corynebacterium sp. Marseille-Q4381 TaxID=3121597 RepID=UPI002FE56B67
MVASSTHHVVRVTVRISAADVHRDIDVTLPTSSALAEVLPELARIIDIPHIPRPWQAATAAGAPLDMYAPLHKLRLVDGSIISLTPAEPPSPPVVRDATESLTAAAAAAHDARGLDTAAGIAGCAGIALVLIPHAGLAAALAAAALALALLARLRSSQPLFFPVPPLCAAAAGAWVAGPRAEWVSGTDPAVGAAAAAITCAAAAAAGSAARLSGPAATTFHLATSTIAAIGALGAWLPASLAPAAMTVLASVTAVTATPGLASRAAGLKIPRIPTAGEELTHSDGYQLDVDARSASAVAVADALSAAAAACAAPALAWASLTGGTWPIALCLATAGALGLHALRHHYPVSRAALTIAALAALAGVVVATAGGGTAETVLAAAVAAAVATAPLWAPHLPELEPTTVAWFERAEAAAIIALIPVAVQMTGLFALIRGL